MSKQDKIVKNAVNWISKIRPEYQVTELTAATQRVMLSHGKAIQILALLTGGACFGLLYMEKKVDDLKREMKQENEKIRRDLTDEMYDEILKHYSK